MFIDRSLRAESGRNILDHRNILELVIPTAVEFLDMEGHKEPPHRGMMCILIDARIT